MILNHNIQITNLSLTGRKHRDKGNPCEDSSLSVNQDGVYVVCLSDGAGASQYTHADLGSKCVVETICSLMVRHFDAFFFELHESVVRSVLVAAVQAELAIMADELSLKDMDSLSATMLFCAVKDTRMICGHIGDGVIARVTGSGLQPVFLPQNGEDASSTIFMTLPDAQDYLRILRTTIDDTHAVVLMTDGLSDMVFDGTKLLLMPVVARLAELGALPKDEGEIQLTQTIRSFIVDASPLSDDASIGVLYIADTVKPDLNSIPSDKENCIRKTGDEMRTVQKEILPRVRIAQTIISQNNTKLKERVTDVPVSKSMEENRIKEDIPEGNSSGETASEAVPVRKGTKPADMPSSRKYFRGWWIALFAVGLFVFLLLLAFIFYRYIF